jgi:DNA (cytosine-5)-methyltransferase 1
VRTHLDLFSGIGGFALAAQWAGYRTIGFCEIDPFCQRVLRKHWPAVPVWGDVRTLTTQSVIDDTQIIRCRHGADGKDERATVGNVNTFAGASSFVDLITAGYPCQPFSVAGKRLGAEDDRHLWPEVRRLVSELQPRRCLFENVAGHINMGLDDVLSDLEEIGYAARPVVVPACAVGAQHRRDRVWILAHAEGGGIRRGEAPGQAGFPAFGGEAVADAESGGAWQERSERAGRAEPGRFDADGGHEAEQRVGVTDDGLSGRLADPRWGGDPMNAFGPDWEDGVPRVVATEKDRVNKLKALGNSIVPQVAYQILKAMT